GTRRGELAFEPSYDRNQSTQLALSALMSGVHSSPQLSAWSIGHTPEPFPYSGCGRATSPLSPMRGTPDSAFCRSPLGADREGPPSLFERRRRIHDAYRA